MRTLRTLRIAPALLELARCPLATQPKPNVRVHQSLSKGSRLSYSQHTTQCLIVLLIALYLYIFSRLLASKNSLKHTNTNGIASHTHTLCVCVSVVCVCYDISCFVLHECYEEGALATSCSSPCGYDSTSHSAALVAAGQSFEPPPRCRQDPPMVRNSSCVAALALVHPPTVVFREEAHQLAVVAASCHHHPPAPAPVQWAVCALLLLFPGLPNISKWI